MGTGKSTVAKLLSSNGNRISLDDRKFLEVIYARRKVSKPEELPLKLLSEPCLTVSHHTAPSYLAVGVAPNFQCANIFEFSFAILSNHFVALFLEFLFLYFLLTHLIKHLFMYLSILYIAVL